MKNHFCFYIFKIVDKPKANLIIIHGMGESSDDYLHLIEFFNKMKYNVLLYDVKGHGKSSGARGDIKDFNIWIDELKNIVDFVKQKNSLKIFLIGHSMGGIIVNNYLVKYGHVQGAIISATPTMIMPKTKYLKYPWYLFNWQKKQLNFRSSKITYISLTQTLTKNYHPYRLDYVTPRFLRNLLFLSILFLQKNFQFYRTPVLCLYSTKDQIVSHQHGIFLMDRIFSLVKKLKLYQKSYHNLFHDIEKESILQYILKWLEQQNKL